MRSQYQITILLYPLEKATGTQSFIWTSRVQKTYIEDVDAKHRFYRKPLLPDLEPAIKPGDYSAEALRKERNQGTDEWKPSVRFTTHPLDLATDDMIGAIN
jgi:hypothetical protein